MSGAGGGEFRHFVLFQHGFWAKPIDFGIIVKLLFQESQAAFGPQSECQKNVPLSPTPDLSQVMHTTREFGGSLFAKENLTCFVLGSNSFTGTNQGVCYCARRAIKEFLPVFSEWMQRAAEEGTRRLYLSCVGHSFGGIIMREFIYLLLVTEDCTDFESEVFEKLLCVRKKITELNVTLENFITIATPHCSVADCLRFPMYYGALILSKTFASSLSELLLKDHEAVLSTQLLSSGHLMALRLFRRRTLFSNLQKDMMVGFSTSSLLFEGQEGGEARIVAASPQGVVSYASTFLDEGSAYSAPVHLPELCGRGPTVAEPHTSDGVHCGCEEEGSWGVSSIPTHLSPRAIAATLRRHLDWHLIVLRYNHLLPMAHVACLGVGPQWGSVPEIARRVAQEIIKLHE